MQFCTFRIPFLMSSFKIHLILVMYNNFVTHLTLQQFALKYKHERKQKQQQKPKQNREMGSGKWEMEKADDTHTYCKTEVFSSDFTVHLSWT